MRKPPPDGIVGYQAFAAERVGEHLFANTARFGIFHALETGAVECRLVDFDDEGAASRRVAVMMRIEIADRRVAKRLRQRVENFRRTEPCEPVGAITHS